MAAKKSKRTPRRVKDNTSDGIGQYVHGDKKRPYNPLVGLVTPETDKEMPKTKYSYDPYLDPELQWAGKKEQAISSPN